MANQTTNINPWKGLNFYKEGDVIYGRNSEIESLSHCIFNNTQTVLFGKSGIGKSSILNAGIFPLARKKGMIPVPIRFNHDNGFSYVEQVRLAIANSGAEAHEIVPVIDPKKETLWEYLHRNIFFDKDGKRTQLLIVLDQFEEIFTLQKDEKTKLAFFDDIADLINDIIPLYIVNANKKQGGGNEEKAHEVSGSLDDIDIDIDINETSALASENKYLQKIDHHFVFTLREDFLSYLERYTAYIPGMKSNRYALLPLNEEQAADIIMKPIEGLIDISVAELIIQKVTGCSDFTLDGVPEIEVDAAVLSLYLSRIFIKKGDQDTITADIVNQFSADIIKDFYEESVANLPQEEIEHLENRLLTYDGRRNNVSRNDLLQEKVSYEVIKTLVEDKKLLRQFSYQDDIRVEYMHDILCPIVKERIDNRAEALKKAEEQRILEEQQMLILAEEKRKREEIEQLAWEERKAAMEQRKRIRVRLIIGFSIVALIATIVLGVYFWKYKTYETYYASFTTENGWPVGLGDTIKSKQFGNSNNNTPIIYYQLTREGIYGKNKLVKVMNKRGEPVPNVSIRLPMVSLYESEGDDDVAAKLFSNMQRQTYYWKYIPDDDGNLQRRTAYDKEGKVLYSILYYYPDASNGANINTKQLWASIVDRDGKPLKVRDNGMDRMRITVDENGHYIKYMFFSENGVPQSNFEDTYGMAYDIDKSGKITLIQILDAFGDSKDTIEIRRNYFNEDFYENGLLKKFTRSKNVKNDIIKETFEYDLQGRLTESTLTKKDTSGKKDTLSYIKNSYNNNVLTEIIKYSSEEGFIKESHDYTKPDSIIISYLCGSDVKKLHPDTVYFNKDDYYYDKVEKQFYNKKVIVERGDTCFYSYYKVDVLGNDSLVIKEFKIKNKKGQMVRYIVTTSEDVNNHRILSLGFDIDDYGNVVGEHVIGLDNNIIRCPEWSVYSLSYYKMKYVIDFNGYVVARKAINEFNEESMIVKGNKEFKTHPAKAQEMRTKEKRKDKNGNNEYCHTYGICSYDYTMSLIVPKYKVDYIHITDLNGAAYRSGLRDGDIMLDTIGNTYKIARPNLKNNNYDILTFDVDDTNKDNGFIVYDVYYTTKEMTRLNQSKENYKK